MPGALLPPYAEPTGPEMPSGEVLKAFLEGRRSGFSEDLHIEGDSLLARRMVEFAARVGPRSLLVRADPPAGLGELKDWVEERLRSYGLSLLEPESRLGDIAAIQVTGIRGAMWDLWGEDEQTARQGLEAAVLGQDASPETIDLGMSDEPGEDSGIGMTLEGLIGERETDGGDPETR